MNANDDIRELILRHLDGSLDEAETRRLNDALAESAELRREFARLLRQEVQLAELGESLAEKVVPLPLRVTSWWRKPLASAAALVVLAGIAAVFWPGSREAAQYRLRDVAGEVWVQRGAVKHLSTSRFSLMPGDVVQTMFGARATVELSGEDTRLALGEEASLKLPASGEKTFDLETGSVGATVARQTDGRPLVFATPHGTARVLGTAFQLSSDAAFTQLAVSEGRVALARRSDGSTVEVGARQVAVLNDEAPPAVHPAGRDGDGTGLLGEYFAGKRFDRATHRRVDARVQFDWAAGPPAPDIHSDHFQVRWSGRVLPRYTGTHRFELMADDGVRLWVDGKLIIDQWNIRSRQTRMAGEVALEAGRACEIRIEYFEASGKAFVSLYWQSDLQAREIIPTSQLFPAPTSTP